MYGYSYSIYIDRFPYLNQKYYIIRLQFNFCDVSDHIVEFFTESGAIMQK